MWRLIIATDITAFILAFGLSALANIFGWDEDYNMPLGILIVLNGAAIVIGLAVVVFYVLWQWALK